MSHNNVVFIFGFLFFFRGGGSCKVYDDKKFRVKGLNFGNFNLVKDFVELSFPSSNG